MRATVRHLSILAVAVAAAAASSGAQRAPVRAGRAVTVASKPFGESYLLCEMFAQLLESRGITVARRPGLGATEIAFGAILAWSNVYPSGGALATYAEPSTPAAPTRLSTTTWWPHSRVRRSATMRPTTSGEVPGSNGMTQRTGLLG